MVTLDDLTKSYYKARANKRRSRDSVVFEIDYESELVRLMEDINSRSFVADGNYAFVVFSPKPREIFATRMRNRIVHHYLDWKMRPIYEKVLSDRSFNNLKKRNNRKELLSFIGSGLKMFRKKLVLNVKKNCFNLKKGRKTWSNSP